MNRLDLRGQTDLDGRLPRPRLDGDGPVAAVRAIIDDVRARGDAALIDLTERFDGVAPETLTLDPEVLHGSLAALAPDLREALVAAKEAIESFHVTQLRDAHRHQRNGIVIEGRRQPVDRAGLYVPGGRAAYPSTVLMTAVPARVAGVADVVLCVPPGPDGSVADVVLAAAAIAGVDRVHPVGGAQAVAAMAYGTESVCAVDTIAGPGNVYVAIAKREVAGRVGIPSSFAGPSEVIVVADDTAPAAAAAIDVIAQAEHGPDGLAWFVTWDEAVADDVDEHVEVLVAESPRADQVRSTLAAGGHVVLVDGPEQAAEVVNLIAPEHVQVMTADPESVIGLVRHAGAVFAGRWSPASIGDYVAGPSHVLPTYGSARFASALTVDDFQKQVHVITVDREAFDRVGPWVEVLARAEGLDAHARSISLRREV